jgi:deoxyribonuclease V
MIYALDVGYFNNNATIACIGFKDWKDSDISYERIDYLSNIKPYQAGAFYKRELPCLLLALNKVENIEYIVIDGYVWLGKPNHYGLGMYLYDAFNKKIPIIGVAKNRFKDTPKECELLRGKSKKPLFITSIGVDLNIAKEFIDSMYGDYRIPKLLKLVDSLTRSNFIF